MKHAQPQAKIINICGSLVAKDISWVNPLPKHLSSQHE